MGEEIQALDYHTKTEAYVIGTSHNADFKLPVQEDDFRDTWADEGTIETFML